MKIQLKECTLNSAEQLQALALQTFIDSYAASNDPDNFRKYLDKAFNLDQLKSEIAHPLMAYYFIFLGETLVGYIKLNEGAAQTDLKDPDALEVERIYILKDFQGKGLGRQLLDFALATAKAKGKSRLWLGVWEHNPSAIQFYTHYGMEAFGEHIFQLGTEAQKDILMQITVE